MDVHETYLQEMFPGEGSKESKQILLKNMSSKFYTLLNKYIGTETLVKQRRKQCLERFNNSILNDNGVHLLPSGSKAEGLEMTGSDEDIMICTDQLKVYFINFPNIIPPKYVIQLHAEPVLETPGFVLIKAYNISEKRYLGILKSTDFVEKFVKPNMNSMNFGQSIRFLQHGPCMTHYGNGLDTDFAVCLSSDQWPDVADEWRKRSRKYGWPTPQTIKCIVRQGCHLVPIGYNGNQAVDWRMSFSVAETTLVHSFNHVQLLTYGFLKLFFKEVIHENPAVDNLLCSYFIKTILFWSIEETPYETWTANNILTCVWMCFKRLMECIENKQCANYFIRNNNMFKKKITDEAKQQLRAVMRPVMNDGINLIFRSRTVRNLWYKNVPVSPAFEERELDVLRMDEICRTSYTLLEASMLGCMSDKYRLIGSNIVFGALLRKFLSKCKDEGYKTVIRNMALQQLCHCIRLSSTKGNKHYYAQNKLFTRFLIAGTSTDISAGKLIIATWLYGQKEYYQCLEVTDYAMIRMNEALYYNKSCGIALRDAEDIENESCGLNLSFQDKARLFLLSDVLIPMGSVVALPEIQGILPLGEWMTKGEITGHLFPPNLYFHFLRACCYSKLGKKTDAQQALYDMKQERPLLPNDQIFKNHHELCYFALLSIFLYFVCEPEDVDISMFKGDIYLGMKSIHEQIENGVKFGLKVDVVKHLFTRCSELLNILDHRGVNKLETQNICKK